MRISYKLFSIVAMVFILAGFFSAMSWAASSSCQTKTEGKLECMEFTGSLPSYIKTVCTAGGSQNTKWVDSACPRDNLLAICDVPRNDNIKQGNYCYRMAELPDKDRIEYCRMSCKGAFSILAAGSSVSANAASAASVPVAKKPESSVPVAASKPKATVSANAPLYAMEQGVDRPGDDYKDFDLASADPKLCATACTGDAKCKAWTYVKPGIQGDKARCWLKNKVPSPLQDENCVSGIKGKGSLVGSTTDAGTQQYVMEQGVDRTGDDYSDFDLASADPKLCAAACTGDAKCKAWTYVKPGIQSDKARCWLKNKVPPPLQDENCVSGIRKQP
jgi:hypothetical protein